MKLGENGGTGDKRKMEGREWNEFYQNLSYAFMEFSNKRKNCKSFIYKVILKSPILKNTLEYK